MNDDATYYRGRALKERQMAEASSDPGVAEVHRQMAEKYESKAAATMQGARSIRSANSE